jgi:hypothetical protein
MSAVDLRGWNETTAKQSPPPWTGATVALTAEDGVVIVRCDPHGMVSHRQPGCTS